MGTWVAVGRRAHPILLSQRRTKVHRLNTPRITVVRRALQGICRADERHCDRNVRVVYPDWDTTHLFILPRP